MNINKIYVKKFLVQYFSIRLAKYQQLRNYAYDSEMLVAAEPYFQEFAVEVLKLLIGLVPRPSLQKLKGVARRGWGERSGRGSGE